MPEQEAEQYKQDSPPTVKHVVQAGRRSFYVSSIRNGQDVYHLPDGSVQTHCGNGWHDSLKEAHETLRKHLGGASPLFPEVELNEHPVVSIQNWGLGQFDDDYLRAEIRGGKVWLMAGSKAVEFGSALDTVELPPDNAYCIGKLLIRAAELAQEQKDSQ